MALFWDEYSSTFATKLFIFSLAITSLNASKIKQVENFEGTVTDFEFDQIGNVYGIENVHKLNDPSNHSDDEFYSLFFKINAEKQIEWKFRFGSDYRIEKSRILTDHKNDVYLINKHKNVTQIYTTTIDHGGTMLMQVSKYSTKSNISQAYVFPTSATQPSTDQIFIVDDNIIFAGFLDEYSWSNSTIRVLKVKSGQWLKIASSKAALLHAAQDTEGNIYFTKSNDVCHSSECKFHEYSELLFVLTKNSLSGDNPRPRLIQGVAKKAKEKVISLKISGDRLYLQLYDAPSSSYKIKVMSDNMLKTIFEKQFINYVFTFRTLEKGAVIRLAQQKWQDNRFEVELLYLTDNDTVVPLYDANIKYLPDKVEPIVSSYVTAASDTEGNIFFENYEWPSNGITVFVYDRTTTEISKIKFKPDNSVAVGKGDFVLDEEGNVWISFLANRSGDYDLYYIRKGTFIAKKVANIQNIRKIRRSQNGYDDIVVMNDLGLVFLKGMNRL